jgi:hypothetical protein
VQWHNEAVQQDVNTRMYGSKQWSHLTRQLVSEGAVWGPARQRMEEVVLDSKVVSSQPHPGALGDWELLQFEGPQRQRKKMVRSKRKLILARDRRGDASHSREEEGGDGEGEDPDHDHSRGHGDEDGDTITDGSLALAGAGSTIVPAGSSTGSDTGIHVDVSAFGMPG